MTIYLVIQRYTCCPDVDQCCDCEATEILGAFSTAAAARAAAAEAKPLFPGARWRPTPTDELDSSQGE